MRLELPRMHGCENRFAVVDEHVHEIPERDKVPLVVAMADRAGVHGVLFLSSRGGLRMRISDRDGTEESMYGNGSTAAAYVCARLGPTCLPVRVSLLGGELTIGFQGTLTMSGPAAYMTPFAFEWPAEDGSRVHRWSGDGELAPVGLEHSLSDAAGNLAAF